MGTIYGKCEISRSRKNLCYSSEVSHNVFAQQFDRASYTTTNKIHGHRQSVANTQTHCANDSSKNVFQYLIVYRKNLLNSFFSDAFASFKKKCYYFHKTNNHLTMINRSACFFTDFFFFLKNDHSNTESNKFKPKILSGCMHTRVYFPRIIN